MKPKLASLPFAGIARSALLLALALLCGLATGGARANTGLPGSEPLHRLGEVERAAAVYVAAQLRAQSAPGDEVRTFTTTPLDPRLRLPACKRLEGFLPSGRTLDGKTVVGVRCTGPVAWRVYVQMDIAARPETAAGDEGGAAPVPASAGASDPTASPAAADAAAPTATAVRATTPASSQASTQASTPVSATPAASGVPSTTAIRSAALVQQTSTADPRSRRAAAPPLVAPPPQRTDLVIQVGQSVRVEIKGAGFAVRTDGKAMGNAVPGQVVRVKVGNGQVVSGIARETGIVELAL